MTPSQLRELLGNKDMLPSEWMRLAVEAINALPALLDVVDAATALVDANEDGSTMRPDIAFRNLRRALIALERLASE